MPTGVYKRKKTISQLKMKKKKIKNPTEAMRKKCVELAKKIVRKQQNYTCEFCETRKEPRKIHGSHIYSEGIYRSMSADIDNILALCYTHHLGWSKNQKNPSWHNNPLEMTEWFRDGYSERYEELKKRSRLSIQCDFQFWQNKYKELTKL